MLKKEAMEIAIDARNELQNSAFNNPQNDIGYDLYSFQLDGTEFEVFAYIGKQKDEDGQKWYSVYAGVEYAGGDTIYADYDNSTSNLNVTELADAIYLVANLYTKQVNLENLRKMLSEGKNEKNDYNQK